MVDILIPAKRQVVVIVEDKARKQIGFALACKVRGSDSIEFLTRGAADGITLSDADYQRSKQESEMYWKTQWPEASIVLLDASGTLPLQTQAELEAEKRVRE